MTAEQIILKLEGLDLDAVADDAFTETEDAFAELNKEQLAAGELNDGSEITNIVGGYAGYSSWYGDLRSQAGLQADHVDLKVTGNFYEGYKATKQGDNISMDSNVDYTDNIERLYGTGIYGLTMENKQKYAEEDLGPVVREKIEAITGLNFK